MTVTAWSYSSDGTPYICVEQRTCGANIGRLQCVEVVDHDGPHRYPMSVREDLLWIDQEAEHNDGSDDG